MTQSRRSLNVDCVSLDWYSEDRFRGYLLIVKVAKSFAIAIVVYALAWLGTYIVLMGGDMTYLGDYFLFSWTGGGELPAFIQFVAASVGLLTWAVAYYKMKRTMR